MDGDFPQETLQHILRQHGANSKIPGKRKFSKAMTPQKIKLYTKTALRKGKLEKRPDGSHKFTLSGLKKPVGKTQNGKPAHSISVIVRDGKVMTAHPSK